MGFQGFLPENSIIMARRRPAGPTAISSAEVQSLSTTESTTPLGENATPSTDSLAQISADLQGCTRCKLCEGRKTIVIGEGNPHAELMFIGEGPGENEDLEGRPFVGKAGQLLDKMIEAMGLKREQVYIANVVKCRPPGNRDPEPDEVQACAQFLFRQVSSIQPKVIVALGKFAAQTLLQSETPISRLRGNFHIYGGFKLMPTFHPSYLLRSPSSKKEVWADLQLVAKELGIEIPRKPEPKKEN
jgi:uracil-DNA glycosylase family 4